MTATLTRRNLLAVLGSLSAATVNFGAGAAMTTGPILGAIRWDPWYSGSMTKARMIVETTLGPSRYQDRAPEFSRPLSDHSISIDGDRQIQIDREIMLASGAGLAFWAYCFYDPDSPLMNAWHLHQSSTLHDKMRWCMLVSSFAFFKEHVVSDLGYYLPLLKQANYQRVLGQRPLVFILDDNTPAADLKLAIAEFRRTCSAADAGDPYLAIMSWEPFSTRNKIKQAGADAISAYSIGQPSRPSSFDTLDKAVRAQWDEMSRTGVPSIPLAITGEDRRPRIEHPVPWEAARQKPMDGIDRFYLAGTPNQIAAEVRAMYDQIAANPRAYPAQCGIIYSWDECDEGGSTLLPTLGQRDAILRAVGAALTK